MMEKEIRGKKRQGTGKYDPLAHGERESGKYQERDTADIRNGSVTRRIRGSSDSLMVHQRENGFENSSDPLNMNGFDTPRNGLDKRNMDDDSYIVTRVSSARDEAGRNKRNAIDIGSEISSCYQTDGNERKQVNYEPHDLSLIPERETEKLSAGYDPALEFGSKALKKNSQAAGGAKKLVKDPKSRLSKDAADKRKAPGPIRKGRPTKMSPLDEARARADKLRNFKADLQKMKKEKVKSRLKQFDDRIAFSTNHIESTILKDINQLVVENSYHKLLLPFFLVLGRGRQEAHRSSENRKAKADCFQKQLSGRAVTVACTTNKKTNTKQVFSRF